MRKSLIAALFAATILVPATAYAQDNPRVGRQTEDDADRPQRPPRADRPRPAFDQARPDRPQFDRAQPQPPSGDAGRGPRGGFGDGRPAFDPGARAGRPAFDRNRDGRPDWQGQQGTGVNWQDRGGNGRPDWRDRNDNRPGWNGRDRDRGAAPDWRDRDGDGVANWRDRDDHRQDWNRNRQDWRDNGYDRGRFDDRRSWNRDWRRDDRYDWNQYRTYNRGIYRLPRYYAPYGWNYGYRRFSIGYRLDSVLFGSTYWIDEPYYYRLPPAYGPYRWVRYYDDALLVDIRSGYVVDVVYGIFW